jgi:DNA-binding transcriptional MerR regulator
MSEANKIIEQIKEILPLPERGQNQPEKKYEQPADFEQQKFNSQKETAKVQPQVQINNDKLPPLPRVSAGVPIKEIERVLSADLEDIYFQLPPDKQTEFKKQGEETANKIKVLLEQAKVKAKKIARLIFDWLKIIPGVNKFFLEKESKIKTDEILKLEVRSKK